MTQDEGLDCTNANDIQELLSKIELTEKIINTYDNLQLSHNDLNIALNCQGGRRDLWSKIIGNEQTELESYLFSCLAC